MNGRFNTGGIMGNLTPVVLNLLIINVIIFFGTLLMRGKINFSDYFASHLFVSDKFKPHQLVTHGFLHQGISHLFMNMIGLVVFGPQLERLWGGKRFLTFYMICLLGSAAVEQGYDYYKYKKAEAAIEHFTQDPTPTGYLNAFESNFVLFKNKKLEQYNADFLYTWEEKKAVANDEFVETARENLEALKNAIKDMGSVGASGAIMGLLMGFALLFPNQEMMLIFPPIPVKIKYLAMVYAFLELSSGFKTTQGDFVGHFAHLGGMLFGLIMIMIWNKSRKNFY